MAVFPSSLSKSLSGLDEILLVNSDGKVGYIDYGWVTVSRDCQSKIHYFTGDIAIEWKTDWRYPDPIDINTEPLKVRRNTLYLRLALVIIFVTSGSYLLYSSIQPEQDDQNQLSEIEIKFLISENIHNHTNQTQTVSLEIEHINEDSSEGSDGPRKEKQSYVVQEGENNSNFDSTNSIAIQELKVIN